MNAWPNRDDASLSSVRQLLAALMEKAQFLAETDPQPERRARHRRLAQWLTYRVARAILREARR